METTIKDQVKNIFKTNVFETALELTRNLRSEYISEYGVKSWNALASYYKKANIQPEVTQVAEPETAYTETNEDESIENNSNGNEPNVVMMEITPDNVGDLHNTLAGIFGEAPEDEDSQNVEESTESTSDKSDDMTDEDTFEYMLYRNTGDKVEWFGHRENFYGLKVGDSARMIRMNNRGVSEGLVVATNALTLDQVDLFHRCYGVIIRMKRSYKEQLQLASECLNKLPKATSGSKDLPANDIKLTDFVLNFGK